jgi:hypothetical protein
MSQTLTITNEQNMYTVGLSNQMFQHPFGNPDMPSNLPYTKDNPETTTAVALAHCVVDIERIRERVEYQGKRLGTPELRYYSINSGDPLIAEDKFTRGDLKALNVLNGESIDKDTGYETPFDFLKAHWCPGLASVQPKSQSLLQFQSFGTIQGIARGNIAAGENVYAVIDPYYSRYLGTNEEVGWRHLLKNNTWDMNGKYPTEKIGWGFIGERDLFSIWDDRVPKDLLKDINDAKTKQELDDILKTLRGSRAIRQICDPLMRRGHISACVNAGKDYFPTDFEDLVAGDKKIVDFVKANQSIANGNEFDAKLDAFLASSRVFAQWKAVLGKYKVGVNEKNSSIGHYITLKVKVE